MKRIYTAILLLVFALHAEVTITGTNTLKFGSGTEWAGDKKDIELKKRYLSDILDMEMVKDNFTFGLRLEASDPSEQNEKIRDLTKKYFKYTQSGLTVSGGDVYGMFGRGVVLDLRENQAEFFDNNITGGKLEYENDYFSVQGLGGKSYYKYYDDRIPQNQFVVEMDNQVYGADGKVYITNIWESELYNLAIGGSYLYMESDTVNQNQYLYKEQFLKKTEIGAVNLSLDAFDFKLYNEYAIKTTFRDPVKNGWANFTSLSYANEGFGAVLEYKDYYNYAANPNENESGFSPYQNPPEVVINHKAHLLKSNPHLINANDEIGAALQLQASSEDLWKITTKFAAASRHDKNNPIPKFSLDYLPYYDFWTDGEYKYNSYNFTIGSGYNLNCPLSKYPNPAIVVGIDKPEDHVYREERTTALAEAMYKINENSSFSLMGEFQLVKEIHEIIETKYNDIFASVEYNLPEFGYANVSMTKTTKEKVGDSPDIWLSVEVGYNGLKNHKIQAFYGRERAGIKCSGGACRQVPEFDGFKLSVVSTF